MAFRAAKHVAASNSGSSVSHPGVVGQEGGGTFERHGPEGAVHRHDPARTRAADLRRAVLGLRPDQRQSAERRNLRQHDKGATIIFSTHSHVFGEEICDHITLIVNRATSSRRARSTKSAAATAPTSSKWPTAARSRPCGRPSRAAAKSSTARRRSRSTGRPSPRRERRRRARVISAAPTMLPNRARSARSSPR